MNKIIAAAQFAADAHAGQLRKWTGAPYITHPARVAARTMLLRDCTESMACAAWLHDTVEDCGVSINRLIDQFGPAVANWVGWLTNPSKGSKAPRPERKRMDRDHLKAAPFEAKLIKLLDRIDNLSELPCSRETLRFCEIYTIESEALSYCLEDASAELAAELRDVIARLRGQIDIVRFQPETPVTFAD